MKIKLLIILIIIPAATILLYFGTLFFISCCWHSERSLEVAGFLMSLPETIFGSESSQRKTAGNLLKNQKHHDEFLEIMFNPASIRDFTISRQRASEFFMYAEKNKDHNKIFAIFLDPKKCYSFIIRGCKYRNKWYLSKIYNTYHSVCSQKSSFIDNEFYHFLTEINYFKSSYSPETNPHFWTNNWRLFKELKYKSGNEFDEEQRPALLKKFGNTCKFVTKVFSN